MAEKGKTHEKQKNTLSAFDGAVDGIAGIRTTRTWWE
jgi:hypothetical protein